ncbi:hypothetical protein [Polycladidibacter stylochi]|uniref:hypothetical protein n=1 Tax=Polycladidibacter stylochi TaxID=1807766 RepID=UPI000A6A1AC9|nr:hypothetical protein [Pseudovibrio stylochi]
MTVCPLSYGRYQRNASISAVGQETYRAEMGTTTAIHREGYKKGDIDSFPVVELKISIKQDTALLDRVLKNT